MTDIKERGQLKRDDSSYPAGWQYFNINSTGTFVIKEGPGVLHNITFGEIAINARYAVYDSATGSGDLISSIFQPAVDHVHDTLAYDVAFENGLTIVVTTAAGDLTISYI